MTRIARKPVSILLVLLMVVSMFTGLPARKTHAVSALDYTLQTLNGGTVSTLPAGKPKVLIFYKTGCYNCQSILTTLKNEPFDTKKVDIIAAEMTGSSKEQVQTDYNSYGSPAVTFCYGASSAAWAFINAAYGSGSITTPFIAYVSADGTIEETTTGLIDIRFYVQALIDDTLDSMTGTGTIEVTYQQTAARSIFEMVNDFRTGDDAWVWNSDDTEKIYYSGLSALVYDYELEAIAMQRAAEVAVFYSHTRPNGTSCFTAYNSYRSCGENIAAGYTSAQSVFTGWREDADPYSGQGHRRNMLNSGFTAIGIGCVYMNGYYYWVQEFRNPASSAAATKANDGLTAVDVEFSAYLADADITASSQALNLYIESAPQPEALPTLTAAFYLSGTWPRSFAIPATLHPDWEIEDPTIAVIEGDRVVPLDEGSTALTATLLGQRIRIPVTVEVLSGTRITNGTTIQVDDCTYTGKALTPAVTITHGDRTLVEGTDYTLTYSNNINAGTGTVTIKGQGDYYGSTQVSFTIKKASQKITVSPTSIVLSIGESQALTIKGAKTKLTYTSSKETVATAANEMVTGWKAGSTTLTITAAETKNYLSASAKVTVKVLPGAVTSLKAVNQASSIKVTWKKAAGATGYYVYRNGKLAKTITDGSTVSYTDKKATENGTKYTYKIISYSSAGKSKDSASVKTYRLSKPAISSLKNSSAKAFKATWKQNTKGSGYQLQYATSSSFTSKKTVTISSKSTVSKTVKSLKKGKTYYVKLRTFKTVSGTKYYSAWSAVKKVKITK